MAVSISGLVKKSLTPLMVLCPLVMAVSGGFVLFQGHWMPLWPPLLALMFSPLVFPLVLFPAAFFSGVMQVAQTAYPKVSRVCMLLTFAWFVLVLSGYALGVYYIGHGLMQEGAVTMLPMLFWTVAVTILPWTIFATKDRDNILFTGLVLMLLVSSAVVVPLLAFGHLAFWAGYWALCGMMAVMLGIQALYEHFFITKKNAAATSSPEA